MDDIIVIYLDDFSRRKKYGCLSDSDGNIRDFVSFVKLCKAGGGIFRGGRRWKFAEE